MKYTTKSPEETFELGVKIGKILKPGNIISLQGNLGAGKTVIAKGIGSALEVKEDITSPTYTIICEYNGTLPFYHMDLYRISDYDEFEMLGVDHMLFGKGVTLIEWSERIEDELPDDVITISINANSDNSREIKIEGLNLWKIYLL